MIANMRYTIPVVLGYLVAMTWFVYGELNTAREDTWLLPLVYLAHIALGVALKRWWQRSSRSQSC